MIEIYDRCRCDGDGYGYDHGYDIGYDIACSYNTPRKQLSKVGGSKSPHDPCTPWR